MNNLQGHISLDEANIFSLEWDTCVLSLKKKNFNLLCLLCSFFAFGVQTDFFCLLYLLFWNFLQLSITKFEIAAKKMKSAKSIVANESPKPNELYFILTWSYLDKFSFIPAATSTILRHWNKISINNWFIRQLCIHRDMKHAGSLESTQEARVTLGYASSNPYASFVLSKLPACFISRWTHSWRMNQLFDNIFNPMENLFSRGICLLTSWACTIGIWSTLAQLNLMWQIYQLCYKPDWYL